MDDVVSPMDLWTASGTFLVLAGGDGRYAFLSSVDGRTWDVWSPSRAVFNYQAGTVIEGELWFVAGIAGVTDSHFELVHTKTGSSWETLGAANGPAPDWVGILGRVGGTWVMSHGQYVPDGMGDGGREELRISDDGVLWTTIDPDGLGRLSYFLSDRFGQRLVVIAERSAPDTGIVALVTTDGRAWQSAPFPDTTGAGVIDVACGATACVAVGTAMPHGFDIPMAWVTNNGLDWMEVPAEMTAGTATTLMQAVVATDRGFLAVGGGGGDAWLSDDGERWRNVVVMAADSAGAIYLLASKGDLILGLGEDHAGREATWLGSLSGMGGG